jgi:uridine phosphorylase
VNNPISPTDLILNESGSVYHLNLLPEHVSDNIIAVGDPDRVAEVSKYFDEITFRRVQREFITHVGHYRGKQVTVISTGIGTDNIEILLIELDALVNIDLRKREPRDQRRKLHIVRIGTSGSLQEDVPVGAHLASAYAIGFDNLMQFYDLPQTPLEIEFAEEIERRIGLPFRPYVVEGSTDLMARVGIDMHRGNTITAPGFYAPQGRQVRIPIRFPSLLQKLEGFELPKTGFRLTNFEMETAAYYSLSRLLGHEALSVNAIIANRIRNEFSTDHHQIVDGLIRKVLDRL